MWVVRSALSQLIWTLSKSAIWTRVGTLGFLAPLRSEKPVQAPCLSRESNKKNRPLRDGLNTSWGLVSDRIGETGFEPAASCSQSKRATKLRHSPAHTEISGQRAAVQPG